jgi:hypothetical protein
MKLTLSLALSLLTDSILWTIQLAVNVLLLCVKCTIVKDEIYGCYLKVIDHIYWINIVALLLVKC